MKIYKPKKSRHKVRDSIGRRNRKTQYAMNYREVEPLDDRAVFNEIRDAWNALKTPVTGYVNYQRVAERLKMPVGKLMMYLKGWHKRNPHAVHFTVDRMGSNVYFRLQSDHELKKEAMEVTV